MNLKLSRPRSCAGWFLWALIALILLVPVSNIYAKVRLFVAGIEAEALAKQLGSAPDNSLRTVVGISDVDIVTSAHSCHTLFYFETPLSFPDFEARLMEAAPGTKRITPYPHNSDGAYYDLRLAIETTDGQRQNSSDAFVPMPRYIWFLPQASMSDGKNSLDFYQAQAVNSPLWFGDRRIGGNIVAISQDAGRYPFWVQC
jgi:hypothetical protein